MPFKDVSNVNNPLSFSYLTILINFLIGGWEPTETQMQAGDMNGDGVIDILDIVQVVNIILGR